MPHRRTIKKGSFGDHFDELVKHFPEEPHERPSPNRREGREGDTDIHDRLFERAWREAGEQ